MTMESLHLEIDGSFSLTSDDNPGSFPELELPPFIASVSSLHSYDEMDRENRPSRRRTMTRRRYNFLCGKVATILVAEMGILLSILVLISCSLYSTEIQSGNGLNVRLNTGFFRFSIDGGQCIGYKSGISTNNENLTKWIDQTTSRLITSQAFSVLSPLLACCCCIYVGIQGCRPARTFRKWPSVAVFFIASLFQILSLVFFDRQSTW